MNAAVLHSAPHLSPAFVPQIAPSVLVVEDERKLRAWLVDEFRSHGVAPLSATAGYEAIRLAAAHRPDLILLDGLLPEMHGFEIARFIRRIDSEYRPRIVMMTAIYKHLRYRNEARLKYGIDAYIVKPLDASVVSSLVASAKENQ